MSFITRAVASTVIFVTLGLASVSAPGLAYDLDRPGIATPAVTAAPAQLSLPDPAALPDPSTLPDDDAGYATLTDALADQDIPDQIDGDLRCLAEAVYFEAKGEPLAGQLAVAKVILNRTESGRFPKSVCSVVKQAGQFSFVRDGVVPSVSTSTGAFRTAVAIAQVAMNDAWDSPASGALYFHARRVSPGWRMTRVASIGNHIFYR
jgi:spore germination cell wall hydrolase CwlJ-like protein